MGNLEEVSLCVRDIQILIPPGTVKIVIIISSGLPCGREFSKEQEQGNNQDCRIYWTQIGSRSARLSLRDIMMAVLSKRIYCPSRMLQVYVYKNTVMGRYKSLIPLVTADIITKLAWMSLAIAHRQCVWTIESCVVFANYILRS